MIHTTPKQPFIHDYYQAESNDCDKLLKISNRLIDSTRVQNKIHGYIMRAFLRMILGNYELALEDINNGSKLNRYEYWFDSMQAETLTMQGDLDRASLFARTGATNVEYMKSNDSNLYNCNIDYCYIVLANISLLQEHYKDALNYAQKVLTRNPEDANAQKIIARIPFNYFLVEALLKSLSFQASLPELHNVDQRTGQHHQEATRQSYQSYSNQNLPHSPNNCKPEEENTQSTYATILSQTSHASLNETSSTGTTHSMQTSLQQPTSDEMSIDFPVQTHSTPPTAQQYGDGPKTSFSPTSFQPPLSSLNSADPSTAQQHQGPTRQFDPRFFTANTPGRTNPRRECTSYYPKKYDSFHLPKKGIGKPSRAPKNCLDRRPSHRR